MTNYTKIDTHFLQGKTIFTKPSQKLLYMFLSSFKECDSIFPSIHTIADAICVNERTVMRTIKDLEEMGLIEVVRNKGESNRYIVKDYTGKHEKPMTNIAQVTELHTNTSSLLKTKNNNNNNLLNTTKTNTSNSENNRDTVIDEIQNQFPTVPVKDVADILVNDSSVVVNTINQFKALLTYRVKNYKPQVAKPYSRKPTRTEMLPSWWNNSKNYYENKPTEIPDELKNLTTKEELLAKLTEAGF